MDEATALVGVCNITDAEIASMSPERFMNVSGIDSALFLLSGTYLQNHFLDRGSAMCDGLFSYEWKHLHTCDEQVAFNKWLFSKSCQPGVQGNVGTLASPSDPLFNLMQPLFDKLAHVRRLAPQYTNSSSAYYIDQSRQSCDNTRQRQPLARDVGGGSAFDDKMPFEIRAVHQRAGLARARRDVHERTALGAARPVEPPPAVHLRPVHRVGHVRLGPVRQLDARGRDGRRATTTTARAAATKRRRRRSGTRRRSPAGPPTSRARCSRTTTAASGARAAADAAGAQLRLGEGAARPTPRARGRPRRRRAASSRSLGSRDALGDDDAPVATTSSGARRRTTPVLRMRRSRRAP